MDFILELKINYESHMVVFLQVLPINTPKMPDYIQCTQADIMECICVMNESAL
jgi:hypothetical protein